MTKRNPRWGIGTGFLAWRKGLLPHTVGCRERMAGRIGGTCPDGETTKLFKARKDFLTGLPSRRRGCGLASKRCRAPKRYVSPASPKSLTENAWLVDCNGKLLKTVTTLQKHERAGRGRRESGDGRERASEGVFQVDMNSQLVSHRQIPLGPANDGGGCHGALWQTASFDRVVAAGTFASTPTWSRNSDPVPAIVPGQVRYHGIAWATGPSGGRRQRRKRYSEYRPCSVRYEADWQVLERWTLCRTPVIHTGLRCTTAS